MYFKDFDGYSYGTYYGKDLVMVLDEVKTIGWLENGHEYPKGEVDEQTLFNLRKLIVTARSAQIYSMDFHDCDFCETQPDLDLCPQIIFKGEEWSLGNSVMWLPSPTSSGIFYAAPDLIYHYIVDHGYRPPDAFLEAVNCYDFDLNWNVWDTRQSIMEKHRQRIRSEENKPIDGTVPRIFTLQPNMHYEIYTGFSGRNTQIIASHYDDRFVVVTFDREGNLTQVIDRPQVVDYLEALQTMFKENGFVVGPIRIKAFSLADYDIGVSGLSQYVDDFLHDPEKFSKEEKAEFQEEILDWNDNGRFEFLWMNDFWCDRDGYITAS